VAGADYVVFGPVFETPEKAPFARIRAAETQGLDALRAAARAARVPLFAVGGVTPERVGECLACGAHGVAAVRGLLGGTSIRANVAGYLRALGGRSSHGTRRARVVRSARRGRAGTGAR
jgi:thiamine-phosphate pyrophosphorylase